MKKKTPQEINILLKVETEYEKWFLELSYLTELSLSLYLDSIKIKTKSGIKKHFYNEFKRIFKEHGQAVIENTLSPLLEFCYLFSMNYFITAWAYNDVLLKLFPIETRRLFFMTNYLGFVGHMVDAISMHISEKLSHKIVSHVFENTGVDLYEIMSKAYCETFIPIYKKFKYKQLS